MEEDTVSWELMQDRVWEKLRGKRIVGTRGKCGRYPCLDTACEAFCPGPFGLWDFVT
jgi:hypothetical protein